MSDNVDLLIIKPGSPKRMYGDLSATLSAIEPPYLGALLAAFIREKGYSVKIIDTEIQEVNIGNPKLINIIVAGQNPSASSTPLMVITEEIIKKIKARSLVPIILTGIHPSALPERTLRETRADFIGRGESFYTMLELLKGNKNVQGLCYLENNKFIDSGWGEVVDTDELPMAAWDLLEMDKYRAIIGTALVILTREYLMPLFIQALVVHIIVLIVIFGLSMIISREFVFEAQKK